MIELIYCSKAKPSVTFDDVKDILDIANEKNKEFGLTGMLIYNGKYFLQILEGDKDNLHRLYENIKNDNRHEQINTIAINEISSRNFENWSMGFFHSKKQINEFIQEDDFDPYHMSYDEAKEILCHFGEELV